MKNLQWEILIDKLISVAIKGFFSVERLLEDRKSAVELPPPEFERLTSGFKIIPMSPLKYIAFS